MEILFSPGVVKHPMLPGDHLHTAPLVPLHKHLTCKQVERTLNAAIGEPREPSRELSLSLCDACERRGVRVACSARSYY